MTAVSKRKEEKLNTVDTRPIVVVKSSFATSAERVFDAWLDPDMIRNWMFNPTLRREDVLRIVIDPRVGGSFSFLVRRDGQEIEYIGKYLEIDRPRRLAFTWAIAPGSPEPGVASRVQVEIVPRGKRCDLTLVQEMPAHWAEYAASAKEAWTKELGVLATTLSPDA
jgi:uncharacterized protein YndB with AHSA1/START domain